MSDSPLRQLLHGQAGDERVELAPVEAEDGAGYRCFGLVRGTAKDRPAMLELRRKDGSVTAIAYSYIERIGYVPESGITVEAGGREIRIAGRNFTGKVGESSSLLQALVRQRVAWLAEADHAALIGSAEGDVVVEQIAW